MDDIVPSAGFPIGHMDPGRWFVALESSGLSCSMLASIVLALNYHISSRQRCDWLL
jgi:hypothetical protein